MVSGDCEGVASIHGMLFIYGHEEASQCEGILGKVGRDFLLSCNCKIIYKEIVYGT